MNKTQITDLFRRLVTDNDPANPIYPTSLVDPILNEASYQIQNRYLAVESNPPTKQAFADLAVNTDTYLLPSDIRSPGVRYVATLSGNTYLPHTWEEWDDMQAQEDRADDEDTETRYWSQNGQYLRLRGHQNSAMVDGIAIWYVNLASLSAGSDIPAMAQSLHTAIAFRAGSIIRATYEDEAAMFERRVDAIVSEWEKSYRPFMNESPQINGVGRLDKLNSFDKRGRSA